MESKRKKRNEVIHSFFFSPFKSAITAMQLERCNIVPGACSQVEFFGTGCVGCVITAKVIIDQGI